MSISLILGIGKKKKKKKRVVTSRTLFLAHLGLNSGPLLCTAYQNYNSPKLSCCLFFPLFISLHWRQGIHILCSCIIRTYCNFLPIIGTQIIIEERKGRRKEGWKKEKKEGKGERKKGEGKERKGRLRNVYRSGVSIRKAQESVSF